MVDVIRIDDRFNGPPDSAHGGVAAGLFAVAVDPGRARVRLAAPPPLGEDLHVVPGEDGTTIRGPEGDVALVFSSDGVDVAPLPWLADQLVDEAMRAWLDAWSDHPFPTCFGCGPGRPDADGLSLYAGKVSDVDLRASWWVPDASLDDGTGRVADWATWAALDCPSGSANLEPGDIGVLGQFEVQVDEAPLVGHRYQVVARPGGREGRKGFGEVAIVAEDGTNLAVGVATWIHL